MCRWRTLRASAGDLARRHRIASGSRGLGGFLPLGGRRIAAPLASSAVGRYTRHIPMASRQTASDGRQRRRGMAGWTPVVAVIGLLLAVFFVVKALAPGAFEDLAQIEDGGWL